MIKDAAAGKLVTAIEHKSKKPRLICLCGKLSPHATRTDCTVARPGTVWWDAFKDVEEGEDVIVYAPRGEIHLHVTSVKKLDAANAA